MSVSNTTFTLALWKLSAKLWLPDSRLAGSVSKCYVFVCVCWSVCVCGTARELNTFCFHSPSLQGQQHVWNQIQPAVPQPECRAGRSSPSGPVRGGPHPRTRELPDAGAASSRHHHSRKDQPAEAGDHCERCAPERLHGQPRPRPRQWDKLQRPGHHLWSGAAQSGGVPGTIIAVLSCKKEAGQCN